MVNQSFIQMKNIGLIIINKAVFFIVFFCLILSCSKEDNPINKKIVGVKLDKFIKDSNYQTINKQKKIVLNFSIQKNDTVVYFERISPYKKDLYLGCFDYKGFKIFVYSNFKNHINKFYNINGISLQCEKVLYREIDLTYRMDYFIKNDSLIPVWQ